jgi:uncharacterized LabA/DUF88 family protein
MIRVGCYIDGFNLYHAIDQLSAGEKQTLDHYKWLNLQALTKLYIDPAHHTLVHVKYFSAFQYWRPHRVQRHKDYIKALESVGVKVVLGQFKEKDKFCELCGGTFKGHEEKESDVNIATHMIADVHEDRIDAAYLISRDSDLAGPLRHIRTYFPKKRVRVIAPEWRRHSKELLGIATHSSVIRREHLEACLFPLQVLDKDGTTLICACPPKWRLTMPGEKPASP